MSSLHQSGSVSSELVALCPAWRQMTSSEPLTRLCVLTVNRVLYVLCSDWTALLQNRKWVGSGPRLAVLFFTRGPDPSLVPLRVH